MTAKPGLDEALDAVKGTSEGSTWLVRKAIEAAYPIIAAAVRAKVLAEYVEGERDGYGQTVVDDLIAALRDARAANPRNLAEYVETCEASRE